MPLSNKKTLLMVAAAAAVLSACTTVGPNFSPPAEPAGAAAASYGMAGDPAAQSIRLDPEARSAGPWWQAFGSPELDRTVRLALSDSPTLAAANATIERAQAEARAVRGEAGVQADATGSVQRERINTQAFGFTGFPSPTISLYSVGGTVSYDLDLFGGRRRASEAAQARVEAAERQADAAYLTLSGNVARQAMRIAGLRAEIAAVNQILADDQRVIDIVRQAQAAGGEAPAASTSAQAQYVEDADLLPPLHRQLLEARHQMALLVGKSPAEWTAPDFDMKTLALPAEVPVALPSTLVRRRPDILAAEAELHQATAQIGVAAAAQYPDIRLSANLTQSAIHPEDLFQYGSTGYSFLSGVTAPVFHSGTLKARREAAEAEARAALARYQETVLRAFVQVADVLSDLGVDDANIAGHQRALALAEANVRDAENAYRLGGGTLMQLVDAQRILSRARRAMVQTEAQRYSDLVALYAATAADWRAAP